MFNPFEFYELIESKNFFAFFCRKILMENAVKKNENNIILIASKAKL